MAFIIFGHEFWVEFNFLHSLNLFVLILIQFVVLLASFLFFEEFLKFLLA